MNTTLRTFFDIALPQCKELGPQYIVTFYSGDNIMSMQSFDADRYTFRFESTGEGHEDIKSALESFSGHVVHSNTLTGDGRTVDTFTITVVQ